jgi:MSHA biogenesis protein MshI
MRGFRAARKEPGWLAISLRENRLSYAHGRPSADGKPTITRFGSTELEAKPHAAEKFAKEMGFGRCQCTTLLTPGEYQLLMVEAPVVPAAELKSAVRWRVKDLIDYPVDAATMDVLDIPAETGAVARGHSIFAVAARNETIRARMSAFEEARIPLSVIDIPETAQRNLAALHESDGRGVALLYFNHEFGLLTITAHGELYFSRRVDIGLPQILGAAPGARTELFNRIVLELQRTFDHFERQFGFVQVARLVIGPEPEETGLHAHLKGNLDLPVERLDLIERISFGRDATPDANAQWQLFHLIGASLRQESKAS